MLDAVVDDVVALGVRGGVECGRAVVAGGAAVVVVGLRGVAGGVFAVVVVRVVGVLAGVLTGVVVLVVGVLAGVFVAVFVGVPADGVPVRVGRWVTAGGRASDVGLALGTCATDRLAVAVSVRRSAAVAEEVADVRVSAGSVEQGALLMVVVLVVVFVVVFVVPAPAVLVSDPLAVAVLSSEVPDSHGVACDAPGVVFGSDVGVDVEESEVEAVVVAATAGDGASTAAVNGSAASSATAERVRSERRGNVTVGVFRQRVGGRISIEAIR